MLRGGIGWAPTPKSRCTSEEKERPKRTSTSTAPSTISGCTNERSAKPKSNLCWSESHIYAVFRTCLDASYASQLWNGVMVMDLIEAFESDLRNKSHFLRCGVTRDVLVREM